MRSRNRRAAIVGAVASLGMIAAGGARAAETLSWSFAATTVAFCNFGECGVQPAAIAGRNESSGSDFNASAATLTFRGNAAAWADPGESGLLADLHAVAFTQGPGVTPGQGNFALAAVQGVQVYKWTGPAFDLDPEIFSASIDFLASFAPPGPSGLVAGFAILDSSVLASNSAATPWFNFGRGPNGAVNSAFQADCSTPGAIGIANAGRDQRTSLSPSTPGLFTNSIGATACNGSLHLEAGDEFVLWSKLYVNRSAPGLLDASHTFSVGLIDLPQSTLEVLAGSLELQTYNYSPAPEPGAWALMILGFGGIGAAARRRRADFAILR